VTAPEDTKEVLERFHAHLDLVDLIARHLARELGRSAELDDLRAMGHQGLLEAARRFDEGRGVTFRRFANYRVRGAMLDGVRKSAPLPRRAHARIRALEAALLVAETAAEDAGSPAMGAGAGAGVQ
jgi:RNA polymerase sigma factor for flagellar operon FliA